MAGIKYFNLSLPLLLLRSLLLSEFTTADTQDFPPHLRGEVPADTSRPAQLGQVMRRPFPWHLYAGTAAWVLVGPNGPLSIDLPPGGDFLEAAAEDDNYRLECRDMSYLNCILSS